MTGTVARNGVSWKKGGENGIISSNKKYYVHPVYNSLTIYDIEESDGGNYRCRAQYNDKVDSATVQLNVSCKYREGEGEGEGGRGRGRGRGRE